MTMTLTITHKSGDPYAALVKIAGKPDVVIEPGKSEDVSIHASASIAIFEVESQQSKDKRNADQKPKEEYLSHVEGAGPAPADTNVGEAVGDKPGEQAAS